MTKAEQDVLDERRNDVLLVQKMVRGMIDAYKVGGRVREALGVVYQECVREADEIKSLDGKEGW